MLPPHKGGFFVPLNRREPRSGKEAQGSHATAIMAPSESMGHQVMQTNKCLCGVLALSAICMLSQATHAGEMQVSRYTKVATTAEDWKKEPLNTVVTLRFPEQIKTVVQAMNYALSESGYTLLAPNKSDPDAAIMYQLQLPKVHRKFENVALRDVLETLAGGAFKMVVDPIRRQVTFISMMAVEGEVTNEQ